MSNGVGGFKWLGDQLLNTEQERNSGVGPEFVEAARPIFRLAMPGFWKVGGGMSAGHDRRRANLRREFEELFWRELMVGGGNTGFPRASTAAMKG